MVLPHPQEAAPRHGLLKLPANDLTEKITEPATSTRSGKATCQLEAVITESNLILWSCRCSLRLAARDTFRVTFVD